MLNHNSATERKETPHANKGTKNKTLNLNGSSKNTINRSTKNTTLNLNRAAKATKGKTLDLNGTARSTKSKTRNSDGAAKTTLSKALKRRAQSLIKDRSIDAQSRALIRYALETNDPWLPELVWRADAGEAIIDTVDFSQTAATGEDSSSEEKIEALTEMICRAGDEPETKSAALLVLMATLENAAHPKALANSAKHFAFTRCAEFNLCGMVDAQIAVLEGELLAGNSQA